MTATEISSDYYRCGFSTGYKCLVGRQTYKDHDCIAPTIGSIMAVVSAILNVFIFPLKSALGVVGFTGTSIYKCAKGDQDAALEHLKAAGICFLGLSVTVAFLALAGFTIPILWSFAILASACALSIIFHVRDAAKAPLPLGL